MAMHKEDNLGLLLKKIHNEMKKRVDFDMQKMDLTFSQHHVLMYLRHQNKQSVSLKELEKHFSVAQSTMAGIVKRLEERGFITAYMDDKDKRVKKIKLSKQGIQICEKSCVNMQEKERELSAVLTKQEKKELVKLLEKLYTKMKEGGTDD